MQSESMNPNPIYLLAAEQVSMQQPLTEKWMEEPILHPGPALVAAQDPSFRDYLSGSEVRRMGKGMKRALVTALRVLADAGVEHPDAILTGTNFGCLDSSEKFLAAMVENGEQMLSPTHFMQSTHNTIGSTLGIYTKSHGYNTTYSHGAISFELALQDAWMQMQLGEIGTALVGGHDEMTEPVFSLLERTGCVGQSGMVPYGEVAMSALLATSSAATTTTSSLCQLAGVRIVHQPSPQRLQEELPLLLAESGIDPSEVGAVMTGINGNPANDFPYASMLSQHFAHIPHLHYKHLFGENSTAPALGFYAAAHLLKRGEVPEWLYAPGSPERCTKLDSILLVNLTLSQDCSLILLRV